jgi:hypothetical protein
MFFAPLSGSEKVGAPYIEDVTSLVQRTCLNQILVSAPGSDTASGAHILFTVFSLVRCGDDIGRVFATIFVSVMFCLNQGFHYSFIIAR